MSMYPVLFLGLGGTGGKVLGVIQNTLARRLRAAGIDQIPEGIQFLHIDVPAQRDAEEGGHAFGLSPDDYHALTVANSTYASAHRDLVRALGKGSEAEKWFRQWAPNPGVVPDSSGEGAHQLRAYGRVVALSELPGISRAIRARLNACVAGRSQLNPTAAALGVTGLPPAQTKPLVIVIGSLTGGSGAGLIGDVLDVLHSLQGECGHTAVTTLFSPDVYAGQGSGNAGLAPNALTAICELIAQDYGPGAGRPGTHYQPTRDAVFEAQNLPHAPDSGAEAYFLVGASSQNGAVFTRPQDVYRVVGSMYADLVMNPGLLNSFVAYTLTNYSTAKQNVTDHLGITSANSYDNPNLMGLGFGQLSIGRGFFARYAHDRFMRLLTDQLLEAHLDVPPSERGKSHDQLLEQLIRNNYPAFVSSLRLNELDSPTTRNDDIYHQVSVLRDNEAYDNRLRAFADEIAQQIEETARLGRVSTENAYNVAYTQAKIHTSEAADVGSSLVPIRSEAQRMFLSGLARFEEDTQARMLRQIPEAIAAFGLPAVLGMLRRLKEELVEAARQLEEQSIRTQSEADACLGILLRGQPGMPRSFRKDSDQLRRVVEEAQAAIDTIVCSDELRLTSKLVLDLIKGTIDPWISTVRSSLDGLRERVDAALPGGGTLRQIWPSSTQGVPDYLRPSAVEFTLEEVDGFPQEFLHQVSLRMPTDEEGIASQLVSQEQIQQQAVKDAVHDLITGMRDDLNSDDRVQWSKQPVAQQAESWVSRLRDRAQAREAVIRLALTAEDLDDRVTDWLNDPDSGTKSYLDCTLREYLNPPGNSVTDQEIRRRHDKMVSEFEALLTAAVPLVQLNPTLFSEVHGETPATALILDSIDAPQLDPAIQARLGTDPLPARLRNVAARLVPNQPLSTNGNPSPSITLLSSTAEPFHLLVAGNILGPACKAQSATSHVGWRNRRSRPLPEYLPLSIETQKRILQGLFVGRMTGQVEITRNRPELLRVRVEKDRWAEVSLRGLRLPHSKIPYLDYPGRLLEGIILAMVEGYRRSSLEPLLPYQVLHALGVTYTCHPFPLSQWIEEGKEFPRTADSFLLSGSDATERRAAVDEAIADFKRTLKRVVEVGEGDHPEDLPTLEIVGIAHEALDELLLLTSTTDERY